MSFSEAPTSGTGPFIVEPYLQLGDAPRLLSSEQMFVMWHAADSDASWSVDFRTSEHSSWTPAESHQVRRVAVGAVAPHRVYSATISGLPPGEEFEYRVHHNGKPVFEAFGQARPPASEPYRCVIMGDCGAGSIGQKKVAYRVYRRRPDFVLIPGDIVYENGLVSEYRANFFPIYNCQVPRTDFGAPLLRSIPFFAGLGAHDTGQPLDYCPDGFAYYMYWSFPLNGPVREAGAGNCFPLGGSKVQRAATLEATGDRYPTMANYSFDYGNSHWTVLDTWNTYVDWNDSLLRKWLEHDLTSSKATWKFVVSYLPPFNSSLAKYPDSQKMRQVVDILQAASVDVVFSGYFHTYQLTRPLRFTKKLDAEMSTNPYCVPGKLELDRNFDGRQHTRADGVVYVTTGCGGHPDLHSPEQTDRPELWHDFTIRYNANIHQFTEMTVEDERLTLRQIDEEGWLIDHIVISKSR